jgi:acetyl-CoA carboxylase biotin carboxylase subunit
LKRSATIRRVLVANRGEIAVRIVEACRREGIEPIVAVSEADRDSLAARLATDVVHIGPANPALSYLRVEQIVAGALLASCDAVHPGYGFLSEQARLAQACVDNGLIFVGPTAATIRRGGDKVQARRIARAAGVPTGVGSDAVSGTAEALAIADDVGYPVVLKAAAGGGGRGMVLVDDPAQLAARFGPAAREAQAAFGDGRMYVERLIENARHVEVQLLGDRYGAVVHLGDRDCSTQRRFQKVVEEAPAAALSPELRMRLGDAALAVGRQLHYQGAGTVEFLVDLDRNEFAFLEVNTRIQVEHPVTEMVTGVDIVRQQLRLAAGQPLELAQDDVIIDGHAIECRINAESVAGGFVPSPGTITRWEVPAGDNVRIDTHAGRGCEVSPYYDSLIAKLIVRGHDRGAAIEAALRALDDLDIEGVDTTRDLHRAVLSHDDFRNDAINTRWLETVLLPTLVPATIAGETPDG